jgi:hypothetical protein
MNSVSRIRDKPERIFIIYLHNGGIQAFLNFLTHDYSVFIWHTSG